MGLVLCRDCEGSISEDAEVCVHCGKLLVEVRPPSKRLLHPIAFKVYAYVSGFVVLLYAARLVKPFPGGVDDASGARLIVFFLWIISVCLVRMVLQSFEGGEKVPRHDVTMDLTSAVMRKIARKDRSELS